MGLQERSVGNAKVLVFSGRADRSWGLQSAVDRLVTAGHGQIAVDLSGADFMDSSGLGELSAASNRCRASGGKLVLINPSSIVTRLLAIVKPAPGFEQYASEAEALAALSR